MPSGPGWIEKLVHLSGMDSKGTLDGGLSGQRTMLAWDGRLAGMVGQV